MRDISPAAPATRSPDDPFMPIEFQDKEGSELLEAMKEFISLPLV
jgi:hypothetical protein